VDSQLDLALSVNAMRERLGLPPLDHESISSYVGHGVHNLVRRALGEVATEEDIERALQIFLANYREHMLDHTLPYPGVRETLEELRGRQLAVLTNKPVVFSREMLAGLGLADFFLKIYGGNSFERKKPDPMGIHQLMREASVSAKRTMMVGDSDTDVLTGRNAGVWTCGVTYGFGAHTLAECPPDVLLDDLRELPRLLDGKEDG
jgi:phosphoglycolate phosphatase